jgi:hypothetical protein
MMAYGFLYVMAVIFAFLAAITILIPFLILLLSILWALQAVRNGFHRKQKWYLWSSTITTRVGKWVDETVIKSLPQMVQDIFYQTFSEPPDIKAQKARERRDIVNIILVKKRVTGSTEIYERLAIGEMSARCWWESQPTRRQIVLQ